MVNNFIDLFANSKNLQEMLVEMKLIATGESFKSTLLTGGVSSNIFRVDLANNSICVKQVLAKLKVAKDWYAPVSRIFAEINWLHTANKIIPKNVPKVLGVDRNRGAFVMQYFDNLPNWKSQLLAGNYDIKIAKNIGQTLGKIHNRTANNSKFAKQFANAPNFFALRLEPYLIEAARQNPDIAPQLINLIHINQTTQKSLMHGDVSPKNILVDNTSPIFLDAECACYGDPAFDLAFLLNHMLLKIAHKPHDILEIQKLSRQILKGYLPFVTWEDVKQFQNRCANLLLGLLLARIDGKSPVEYLTEPARRSVRDFARHLLTKQSVSKNIQASNISLSKLIYSDFIYQKD